MSGFDPEAVVDALTELFTPDEFELDVYGFVPEAPSFPALGIFPDPDFLNYDDTIDGYGTMNVEFRFVFSFGAEDSMRSLYRLLAKGAGHPKSLVNVLLANRTLGGLVHDIRPIGARYRAFGDENSPLFEGMIRVQILMDTDF